MFGFVKHWRVGLLGGLISLLAIYFIVAEIDFQLLDEALESARFIYVLPGVLFLTAGLVARAVRWRLLLSNGLPLSRSFHILNIAYLVNGVLPLRVGELARAYLAARAEPAVPVFKSISTVIVERLLDVLTVVLMMTVALAAGPAPRELRAAGLFFGSVGAVGFLFLLFLARQRDLAQHLLAFFTRRLHLLQRFNPANWLDHFLDGLLPLTQARTLAGMLVWTAISWAFSAAAGYTFMYTFYDHADWTVTFLYIAAASFSIAVPVTMGNLGVYEASIVLVVMALNYGESETQAIAFAVTVHAAVVGVSVITGIIGFIAEGITLGQLSRGVEKVKESEIAQAGEY